MIIELSDLLHGYIPALEARLPGQPGLPGDLAHPLPGALSNLSDLLVGHMRVDRE